MPPAVEATGIPNTIALATFEFLPNESIKGITAASTIEVVAVFEINIEDNMVTAINAIKILRGLVPAILSVVIISD